ncbi:MAG: hypothetical protein LBC57_09575 [Treponema sp.]|jgi:hypothetical protein|nr:hypothetical protein [Treponema sp.]
MAASLANGDLRRFVEIVRRMKGPLPLLHFFLISAMLYIPLMHSLARSSPWEMFQRLTREVPGGITEADFNEGMYLAGYGGRVLLPLLFLVFLVLLVLQAVFFGLGAVFLGLNRWNSQQFSFRDRFGIFVMSSTIPVILAALFGFFIPVLHIVVFYLAEILLAFHISNRYDAGEKEDAF